MRVVTNAARAGVMTLVLGGISLAGMGAAEAAPITTAPQATPVSAASWHPRDYCDDWNHRGDRRRCGADRWYWDAPHHRWHHQRYDARWHRWYDR